MGPQDISILSLLFCILLLLIPIGLSFYFKLGLTKSLLSSAGRMIVQLIFMGIYLTYLFRWNNWLINAGWFLVMICVATFSVVKHSDLNKRFFILPIFASFALSVITAILYFNWVVLRLDQLLEAKYFIVIGGMMLGNSMRGNIIGISVLYKDLKRDEERYLYRLAAGATIYEAVLPYLRNSLTTALKPSLASMATMGIVFIPGMMTGQILGGASPLTAIKYQIAIMVSIFMIVCVTITLTFLFTLKISFDRYGLLKRNIFS